MDEGKYRSIFHGSISPADAFRAARDEMRRWLRHKQLGVDAFDRGDPRVGVGAVLLHIAANAADGSQTERWQLREIKDGGTWLSTLTVHTPAYTADTAATWFWVEVESPVRASVPRLARACRVLLKDGPAAELIGAVRAVAAGGRVIDPRLGYPPASPGADPSGAGWRPPT